MVAVISEPTAITAEVKPREYPRAIRSGPRMRASIAASATAAPETPPISVESTIQTCASPPAIHETSVFEQPISRVVIPEWFIM